MLPTLSLAAAGANAAKILAAETSTFQFGRFQCSTNQAFFASALCIAFVNLRPIVPGHVLVIPKRPVARIKELTDDELSDLWRSSRVVQSAIEVFVKADGFNLAVQDGASAGQSVPHVHVHVLPRKGGDFARNDDVYDHLEAFDGRPLQKARAKLEVPDDSERKDRTEDEMAAEAATLRDILSRL